MINSINFKGTYIAPATVKKFNGENYTDKKVALVELSTDSDEDMRLMNELSYEWDHHLSFAADIRDKFSDYYVALDPSPKEKFYVLTEQKKNFDNLDSLDVLATTQLKKIPEGIYIDFLQVAPDYGARSTTTSPFKNVGSGFLDAVKSLYPKNNILLDPIESAINFYKKNGFKTLKRQMIFRAK